LIQQERQRVAVGPGNAHFISVRQMSSRHVRVRGPVAHAATLLRRQSIYYFTAAAAYAAVYRQCDNQKLIIINYLWLRPNMKIRHGAIVENIIFNL